MQTINYSSKLRTTKSNLLFATLACQTAHVETQLISEDTGAATGMDIELFQRVQVSKTDFVETSASIFLAEVMILMRIRFH